MNLHETNQIDGAHSGLQVGQNQRVDELNTRIGSRMFSDSQLEPNYDPRPVATKQSIFPVINRRKPVQETRIPYPEYNQQAVFNPGNDRAPVSGYINNVDTETVLRNQTFSLQKDDKHVYVPSSNSDLYKTTVISRPSVQPHPNLFARPEFSKKQHPNVENIPIGNDEFFNHTRTQLRNMM